ncbi:acetate--CoA ligase family protein [Maritimibacter sp. HL-12]|uniref:acetate--CoA ligase family protein n=1 Tax=Maritimibacter sp. HL-12 TaxID=1162418 RepID=UPI000A0EEC02|nr:acetate--CoA ligase [Maritimibacter sp. HL-12]SMH28839.1 Acyl-CoA synthetase (NDP forming) [Maritimibacter sp. HL-12]
MTTGTRNLGDCIFRPRSVALIGASADPAKNNARPQRYLAEAGFRGQVLPINPSRSEVMGQPAYPTLDDVPGDIDHAFVMVPAGAVEAVIEQCVRRKVPVATIFTAGFAETGPEGAALQARIVEKARAGGVRLLGPNCIGLVNVHGALPLTTNAALLKERLVAGPVSVVSQSGSMLGSLLTRAAARGIGFAKMVSIGNEADLSVGDIVSILAEDDETKVILLFLETIRDGPALAAAARRAFAAGKPVIAYKLGRSALGRRMAASHTGAMVGADEVAQAFFRAHGILRVETMEGLVELPRLVEGHAPPQGRGVAMLTATGGAAAMIADRLGTMGDTVPEPPEALRAKLAAAGIEISDNPLIDLPMGTGEGGRYARILTELMASDHCDAVISVMGSSARSKPAMICERVTGATLGAKPLAVFLAPQADECLGMLHEAGIAGFRTPESCADAVHAYLRWRAPEPTPAVPEADLAAARAFASRTAVWDERAAAGLFAAIGVPGPEAEVFRPGQAAPSLSGPLAVKVLSPDILHKTDAGLVALNVAPAELEEVAGRLLSRAADAAPGARLDGVLVQPMMRGLAEVILGWRHDAEAGPVVVLGMGGTMAELRPQISVRVAPVDSATARGMIADLPDLRALDGYRNLPRGDLEALAEAVVRFSRLGLAVPGLAEAEINPLLVCEEGAGVVALDALVVMAGEDRP